MLVLRLIGVSLFFTGVGCGESGAPTVSSLKRDDRLNRGSRADLHDFRQLELEVVRSSVAPPPVSGGYLEISPDGNTAVAADPDSDRVWFVDTESLDFDEVELAEGDEPGRVAFDPDGDAYVALRGGGAVVRIARSTKRTKWRTRTCSDPRGVAFDDTQDSLWAACANGQLVELSRDGLVVRKAFVDSDLRDVVVMDEFLLVSRFVSAEILRVDRRALAVTKRLSLGGPGLSSRTPSLAYRFREAGNGKALAVYNAAKTERKNNDRSYSQPDEPMLVRAVAFLEKDAVVRTELFDGVLPVDAVLDEAGAEVYFADYGAEISPLRSLKLADAVLPVNFTNWRSVDPDDEARQRRVTSVASRGKRTFALTRNPWALVERGDILREVELSASGPYDTGHELFHRSFLFGSGVACASCHGEGGSDGNAWTIGGQELRTPDLRGGILTRAPFHWAGDLADMQALADEVLTDRMAGPRLNAEQADALGSWIDTLRRAPLVSNLDPALVAEGKKIFNLESTQCSSCHSGAQLTNNDVVDVGTGGPAKVPSLLGLGQQEVFMRSGCADSLDDRYDPKCGGTEHGQVAHLNQSERSALNEYLRSL